MTDDPTNQPASDEAEQAIDEQQQDIQPAEGAEDEPQKQLMAVVYMGGLDDCQDVMAILDEAGVSSALNAADLVRPDLRSRGYYLVTVAPGLEASAREAIEAQFKQEFNIAPPASDEPVCPACGTPVAVDAASCPDCGLAFT